MKPYRIVVIDDSFAIREEIKEILHFEGFDVAEAKNGKTGIELVKTFMPDVILCDIMMPEMDGYEVFDCLKKEKETATIPFIFITAKVMNGDIRKGMNIGADDYLTKPFTASQLLSSINMRIKKITTQKEIFTNKFKTLQNSISQTIPHELLTPLNGILGFTQLLEVQAETITPERIKHVSHSIHGSAKRLLKTIRKFINFSQIELYFALPNKKEIFIQSVTANIKDIVFSIGYELAVNLKRESDFKCELKETDLMIFEKHFFIIMEELIENALKFTKTGQYVKVYSKKGKDKYSIIIEDNGRGIDDFNIKNIMAYNQFNRDRYEQQGLGLGLIIVKRITEFYNIQFDIQSEKGKGTKVAITFQFNSNNSDKQKMQNEENNNEYAEQLIKHTNKIKIGYPKELISTLQKKFIPTLNSISTLYSINEVLLFSEQLLTVVQKYKIEPLEKYCNELTEVTKKIDINEMKYMIEIFPNLVEIIKQNKGEGLTVKS
jgi:CheY-like chemotaxis protein/anti-sigma regulatory factor (Ser/Thr protein kinase)